MNSFIIAGNIIKRLLKEITAIGFLFVFPILGAVLAIMMFSTPKAIEVGVVNQMQNDYGLVEFINKTESYNISMMNEEIALEQLKNKKIKAVLVLPDNFDIKKGIDAKKRIKLYSESDSQEIQQLKGLLEAYLGAVVSDNQLPTLDMFLQKDNSNERSRVALGMLTMFVIMFAGTGMSMLIEEKKSKTFMRTFCAPIREHEMMLGQLLANLLLGIIQIGVFMAVTILGFKLQWGTAIINMCLILLLYQIAAIGLGVGIAGLVNDATKYNMILTIMAVTMNFISGAFFPINGTGFLEKLANFTPQKWVMSAYEKLSTGSSLQDISMELLIIALFGIVLFTFGIKTLKPATEDL